MIKKRNSHHDNRNRSIGNRRLWSESPLLNILTFAIAAVWLIFGLGFKVLGMVPRHRLIVAAVIGEAASGPLTIIVGVAETGLAFWILTRVRPRLCATVQSLAIVVMNTFEITYAENLLLSPVLMICANALFLGAVWYWALNIPARRI